MRTQLAIRHNDEPEPTESPWPISPSPNNRYLIDGAGNPRFILGDNSLHTLFYSFSEKDAISILKTRASQGFNATWSMIYGDQGPTLSGFQPFSPMTDVSRPNESYFAHMDRVLNAAKELGILVFLGISGLNARHEDTPWLNNGATKLHNFGTFLGNRWRDQGNLIWFIGNDWGVAATYGPGWNNASQNTLALALADGIRKADGGRHPWSLQGYPTPTLPSDARSHGWSGVVNINTSYTYAPAWVLAKRSWQVSPPLPCCGFEYNYETDTRHGYTGTPLNTRKNLYWGVLYGTIGGCHYGHGALTGLKTNDIPTSILNTTCANQMRWLKQLFSSRRWYDLVPDHGHVIGTSGLGSFQTGSEWNMAMDSASATTVAATPDGALCVAYMERRRDLTINMAKLANGLSAKWFNPETGTYTVTVGYSGPFQNTGSRVFSPPTRTGDNDWVLVLEPSM